MSSVDTWMIPWWFSRFVTSITSLIKMFCKMWHPFLTPSQLLFPVHLRKPHVFDSHQKTESQTWSLCSLPLHPFTPSPSPWPVAFSWAPSNYIFKSDTRGSIITLNTICLEFVFGHALFFSHLNPPSFSHIFSKAPSVLPHPSISNPFFSRSGFCRWVFAVGETSAHRVNHLYCSIAISPTLWCSLGMSNGTKKTHKPHNYRAVQRRERDSLSFIIN